MSLDLDTVRDVAAEMAADAWGPSEVDVHVEPKLGYEGDDYLEVSLTMSHDARYGPSWGDKAARYVVDVWLELTRKGESRFPLVRFFDREPLVA